MKNIYYFIGNITSHAVHALPLYQKLGGTFVVTSKQAQLSLEKYNVPVLCVDNVPAILAVIGRKPQLVREYTTLSKKHKNTIKHIDTDSSILLFYELYTFTDGLKIMNATTVFMSHGNMLKDYIGMQKNRAELLNSFDYIAALGPYMHAKFIAAGIPPTKLVKIGIARTDSVVINSGSKTISDGLQTLGCKQDDKIITYAPTFWGDSSIYNTGKKILEYVDNGTLVLFRPHPQTPSKLLKEYRSIIGNRSNILFLHGTLGDTISIGEMFNGSDCIIGDLSSVMLEAILIDKPLLFAYDDLEVPSSNKDYDAIQAVVDRSSSVTLTNVDNINVIVNNAISAGIDKKAWSKVKDYMFYDHDGNSVKSISEFLESL